MVFTPQYTCFRRQWLTKWIHLLSLISIMHNYFVWMLGYGILSCANDAPWWWRTASNRACIQTQCVHKNTFSILKELIQVSGTQQRPIRRSGTKCSGNTACKLHSAQMFEAFSNCFTQLQWGLSVCCYPIRTFPFVNRVPNRSNNTYKSSFLAKAAFQACKTCNFSKL